MTWLMLPAGLAIATMAMFSGVGGGVLWMPLLISVFGIPADQAVATALFIQIVGMASGTFSNHRHGMISHPLLLQQATVAAPMVVLGAAVCRLVLPGFIELCLGLLIFVIAYLFLRGDGFWDAGTDEADLNAGRSIRAVAGCGGFLTGFLSIGIGDWLVPVFNRRCGLTMGRSIATGVALMLVLSILGAAVHLAMGGTVAWELVMAAAPGVIVGGQIGSALHRRFSDGRLKEVFVLLLLALAAHVTFNAI